MRARLLIIAGVFLGACTTEALRLDPPPVDGEPCLASFVPPVLAIGVVERGRPISRTLGIRNDGAVGCVLESLRVREDDGNLSIDSPAPLPVSIGLGETLFFRVELTPPGSYSNAIVATMSRGERFELPISASGADASLLIAPDMLSFEALIGCMHQQWAQVINTSSFEVLIHPRLESEIFTQDVVEATLASGASATVNIMFAPPAEGTFEAKLIVDDAEVALSGTGVRGERVTDTFHTDGRPQEDVLLVIDDSLWMIEQQSNLETNLRSLIEFVAEQEYDQTFAITTMDMTRSGAQGRLLPLDGARVLTATTPWSEWLEVLPGVSGSTNTHGLDAMTRALSAPQAGFPRAGVPLAVVIISAFDDESPDLVDSYLASLPGPVTIRVVAGGTEGCDGPVGSATPSPRYLHAAEMTGGIFEAICGTDWGRSLQNIGIGFPTPARFFLTQTPRPSSIEVFVDGFPLPAMSSIGQIYWNWDSTTNSVRISPVAEPLPDSEVVINYELGCGRL